MTIPPSHTETIYVRLLNEGTDVWRPTQGRKVGPMTFEILPTPGHDPEVEAWQFLPGMVVVGRHQRHGTDVVLEAWHRAPTFDHDETTDLADDVARSAGLRVVRNGALRLVKSDDVPAFLGECAARRLFITYAEAFELDAGHPQSVEWADGHEFTIRETGLDTPRLEQVEAFAARVRAPDRWFDFVVHRPRRVRFHWSRCPMHVAELPPLDPRAHRIELAPLRAVLDVLESRRDEAHLAVVEIDEGTSVEAERVLRDLAVRMFGAALPCHVRVAPPRSFWKLMPNRITAHRYLTRVVSTDLAYGVRCMEPEAAENVVAQFTGQFGAAVSYYTYCDVTPDGGSRGGDRLTDATLEEGIGLFDGRRAGILVVTGED